MRSIEGRAHRLLSPLVLSLALAQPAPAEAPTYAEVSAGYREADYLTDADVVVRIEAEQIARQGGGAAKLETTEGVRTASWEREGHWIEWTFTVPRRGLYTIEARYQVPEVVATDSWYLSRAISIDGTTPFRELQDYYFMDVWGFDRAEREYRIESFATYGEKPSVMLRETEPIGAWQTALLTDRETASIEPYLFLLAPGTHTLGMRVVTRPAMRVDAFTVRSYRPLRPYAEVAADYERHGYQPTSGIEVRVQAEQYLYQDRNTFHRQMGGTFDAAAVLMMRTSGDPQGDYNTVALWRRWNHSIFWTFEIPETGLYRMVVRYSQDQDSQMQREIRIDGKVPFRELSPYVMKGTGGRLNPAAEATYDVLKWRQVPIGKEVPTERRGATRLEPYLFYLEKGSHVLQMRPLLGPEKVKIKRDIEAVRDAVSGPFQQVKQLLGQYASLDAALKAGLDLRKELPDLAKTYAKAASDLDGIMREMLALAPPGRAKDVGPPIAVLTSIREELNAVVRNPNVLLAPEQFDTGYGMAQADSPQSDVRPAGGQGNFEARVINELNVEQVGPAVEGTHLLSSVAPLYYLQPVEVDWIAFASPDVKIREPVAPWFYTLQWMWREFLRSFTQ